MTIRGLSGDFETMPMRDLIGFLANRAASGVLTLEKEGTKKQLHLESGSIINASSNLPREFLGQFLINLGHITEEQFTKAWETQQETKVFLGRILVMIGLVTEDVVVAALATKFRETLQEAFDWKSGTFAFVPGLPPPPSEGLDVRVSLMDVYKDAEVRAQAWERLRSVFPSPRCTLEVREEFLELTPADGSIDLKLLAGIDSGRTIEELALGLHATDFVLYQRLYALHAMGAISVRPPRAEPEPELSVDIDLGERPTPERLLESARELVAKARYRDAYTRARRAQQLEPTPAAALLLKQIETAWLPNLRAGLLGGGRRPTPSLSGEQLAALPLSAAERYLLSRVDGVRALEAIVRVAPLGEFEALSAFDRFLAQGWITR
ncbi:MAG: DUF4388 domain-containing protein [Myxococcaceae bacterium]|nr:DUF4388 domain-containing protein [Myxococcaceae bacterium]MCA3014601.1 DUF4388 domain-containing protein [Myxococcaceae bacterium]